MQAFKSMDLWQETTSKTSIWNEKRTVAKATKYPVILCETHNIMKKIVDENSFTSEFP